MGSSTHKYENRVLLNPAFKMISEQELKADGSGISAMLDPGFASSFAKARELLEERSAASRHAGSSGRGSSATRRADRATQQEKYHTAFGGPKQPGNWAPYKRPEPISEIGLYHVPASAHRHADHKRSVISRTKNGKWRVGQQVLGMGIKPPDTALVPSGALYDPAVWPAVLETRADQEARRLPVQIEVPRDVRVRTLSPEPSEARAPTWGFARGNTSSLAAASSVPFAPMAGELERALEEARMLSVHPRRAPVQLTWNFAKPTGSSPAAANSTMAPPMPLSPRKQHLISGNTVDRYQTYTYTGAGGYNQAPFGLSPIPSGDPSMSYHDLSQISLLHDPTQLSVAPSPRKDPLPPVASALRPAGAHLDLTPLGKTLLTRERKERVKELRGVLRGIEERQRAPRGRRALVASGRTNSLDDAALRSFNKESGTATAAAGDHHEKRRPIRDPTAPAVDPIVHESEAEEEPDREPAGPTAVSAEAPSSAPGPAPYGRHQMLQPIPELRAVRASARAPARPAPAPEHPQLSSARPLSADGEIDAEAALFHGFVPTAEHMSADAELRVLYDQVQNLRELVLLKRNLPAQASEEISAGELARLLI